MSVETAPKTDPVAKRRRSLKTIALVLVSLSVVHLFF